MQVSNPLASNTIAGVIADPLAVTHFAALDAPYREAFERVVKTALRECRGVGAEIGIALHLDPEFEETKTLVMRIRTDAGTRRALQEATAGAVQAEAASAESGAVRAWLRTSILVTVLPRE